MNIIDFLYSVSFSLLLRIIKRRSISAPPSDVANLRRMDKFKVELMKINLGIKFGRCNGDIVV
jgi:hypothetical protein